MSDPWGRYTGKELAFWLEDGPSNDEIYFRFDDLVADADALLAVVRAAQQLVEVWNNKGHGGRDELEAHMKIATTVAILPEHLR